MGGLCIFMLGNYITIFPRCQRKKTCFVIFFPVSSALPQARVLRQGRRAGSSRHTDVMAHEGRAATEGRPYGAISVLGDAMAAAAVKPRLSLRTKRGRENAVGASPRLARPPLQDVSPVIPPGFGTASSGAPRPAPSATAGRNQARR